MEGKLEKIAESPAVLLEKSIAVTKRVEEKVEHSSVMIKTKSFWKGLGPGLVTGAADDDPSGITTYSQAGSMYGFQLLWLAGFTFPFMAIVQEMCARLGLVTGRGLAGNIRIHFPRWALYICAGSLCIANTLNIGANLGIMAKATQLLLPQGNFFLILALFTISTLLLQIFTSYEKYASYLKYLVFVLISYVATAFVVGLDWKDLFTHTFVPSLTFSKDQLMLVTGILGTTISPYLFFWQTSHEVEEEILHGKTTLRLRENATDAEIKSMRIDVWVGMFLSNLIMYFIIATCAAVLFKNGMTSIASAEDAAAALRPLAGDFAFVLFAVGIIGMGLLSVPVLAGAVAYTVTESFRWKSGLHYKLHEARAFYGVLIISMLIGFMINLFGIDTIKLLIYTAVVNGLVAPVILFFIITMTGNKHIMKERTNTTAITVLGWIITLLISLSGIATIVSFFI